MLTVLSLLWLVADRKNHKGLPVEPIMQKTFVMHHSLLVMVVLTLAMTLLTEARSFASGKLGNVGTFRKWSKVEVVIQGPKSNGTSISHNPFKKIVTVRFLSPNGRTYRVPAFYDGDGRGGLNGSVWKVRFSPDAVGAWTFTSLSEDANLNDYQGSFVVDPVREGAQYFAKWGRLEYVGSHYLKFRDGSYWLKGGADEPESFLGPGVMGNWNGKRAAADYLSSKGVKSIIPQERLPGIQRTYIMNGERMIICIEIPNEPSK